jgi:hypothetical protein
MIVVFFLCTREAPDAADNATALYCAALSSLTADRLRTLMLYATRCPGTSCSRRSRRWRGSAPCQRSRAARVRGTSPTTPGGSESYRAGQDGQARLSVYSTPAAAVYALDRVLLPDQVFPTEPAVAAAPPPAPMPAARRGNATDDGAPAATDGDQEEFIVVPGRCRARPHLLPGSCPGFWFSLLM